MLVLGSDNRQKLLPIDENDLRYNTVIIGQSGSGKSYFITRLLEEIVLASLARLIVIDANGDFSSFFLPREEKYWNDSSRSDAFRNLDKQGSNFDDFQPFSEAWTRKRFQLLTTHERSQTQTSPNTNIADLTVYWSSLTNEQDFFLDIDPIQYPKLYQGTIICVHFVEDNKDEFPNGANLRDFEKIAKDFGSGKVAMAEFPEASMLTGLTGRQSVSRIGRFGRSIIAFGQTMLFGTKEASRATSPTLSPVALVRNAHGNAVSSDWPRLN